MQKVVFILLYSILFSTTAKAQLLWHQCVITGLINTSKYTHYLDHDKRIEKTTSQSGKSGNIGIGYTINNKLIIGVGIVIEKNKVMADDTVYSWFLPQEFGNRKYEGKRIAPAIWAVYSLPITGKIYFNSELSISIGNRRDKLKAFRYKYTTATLTETTTNYFNKKTNVGIILTPSVSYKISKNGFVNFNFTEIGLRKGIYLTPEATA